MIEALTSADASRVLSVGVKALVYLTTLLAAGGVLAMATLTRLDGPGRRSLVLLTALSALSAAALSALRLPLRASYLTGGTIDGAMDPVMLEIVLDSPLGESLWLRLVGLALILALMIRGSAALRIAALGALLTAASFALRGHALGEPRLLLGALATLHILALAFWIGALAPLHRAARAMEPRDAGALAEEFGRKALLGVGLLVLAGAALFALLVGASFDIFATPYEEGFGVKIALFIGVLGLAALNKLRLAPALRSAEPEAGPRLRRSIRIEALLILATLVTTAAMTTLTSPPPP